MIKSNVDITTELFNMNNVVMESRELDIKYRNMYLVEAETETNKEEKSAEKKNIIERFFQYIRDLFKKIKEWFRRKFEKKDKTADAKPTTPAQPGAPAPTQQSTPANVDSEETTKLKAELKIKQDKVNSIKKETIKGYDSYYNKQQMVNAINHAMHSMDVITLMNSLQTVEINFEKLKNDIHSGLLGSEVDILLCDNDLATKCLVTYKYISGNLDGWLDKYQSTVEGLKSKMISESDTAKLETLKKFLGIALSTFSSTLSKIVDESMTVRTKSMKATKDVAELEREISKIEFTIGMAK
jgi:hypothetical protein